MREKYSIYDQEANSSLEDTHPGATGKEFDAEIIYMSLFLGRLKGGDKWITLPAYEPTHSVRARLYHVFFCTSILSGNLIREYLQALGMKTPQRCVPSTRTSEGTL